MCDTKREPLKQQGTLGVYIASVKHDGGQEKLFKGKDLSNVAQEKNI